jgi:hypothetical protein
VVADAPQLTSEQGAVELGGVRLRALAPA